MKNSFLSFDDTKTAFSSKSDSDLKRAYWLFRMISYNWLVKISPPIVNLALKLRLPIKGLIRQTVFRHFCGGESIDDCQNTIQTLSSFGIGTILDYSVEGRESEKDFDNALAQTLATVERAKGDSSIPFSVFKPSGFGRMYILEKSNSKQRLTEDEQGEFNRFSERVKRICEAGYKNNVPIFIDAEDSWIQDIIDELAVEMMAKYNREKVIIYNTIQLYRRDRLAYLKSAIAHARNKSYKAGFKLVRGAYMEKERERALKMGYPSPIQKDKPSTDRDYNSALELCMQNLDIISICAGTHNEASCLRLTEQMKEQDLPNNHPNIWFSQLLGMSDHISFNLAAAGYNVSKYVPYGPVASVLPYLIRRAQENTSISGQTSRELTLITQEINRRQAERSNT
ncbi:MAG: proline dehydrogenase [Bacteroidetes bacterium]|nr:MAG: proline dehydrogenase [Bacteroidota bacterium]